MILTTATLDDLPEVMRMRDQARQWLRERGSDQWQKPWPDSRTEYLRMVEYIRTGAMRMLRGRHGKAVGSFAITDAGDPRLWTQEELAEPALYLHGFMIRRELAGTGGPVLDWVSWRAAAASEPKKYVRIDVWTTNYGLQRYYRKHGFQDVRTVHRDDGYPSGALFQRVARLDDIKRASAAGIESAVPGERMPRHPPKVARLRSRATIDGLDNRSGPRSNAYSHRPEQYWGGPDPGSSTRGI